MEQPLQLLWLTLYGVIFCVGLDLRPGAGGFAVTTLPALETVTLIAALKVSVNDYICTCYEDSK